GDAVADLMRSQQLVVDDAVEELKPTEAEEEACPRPARGQRPPGSRAQEQEEPADDGDELPRAQQAIGEQTDQQRRAIVEVVPGEQLVEDDLVDGGHDGDPDQGARPDRAGRVGSCLRRWIRWAHWSLRVRLVGTKLRSPCARAIGELLKA